MSQTWKAILTCLLCMLCMVILTSQSSAQVGFGFPPLWDFPSFSNQPLQVPNWGDAFLEEEDILVDDFEYWDSPFNHGWKKTDLIFYQVGYGGYFVIFNTVSDLQHDSRVLDTYRPNIGFVGFGDNGTRCMFKDLTDIKIYYDGDDALYWPALSFDFRAPLGIEPSEIFELDVFGKTKGGYDIYVRILPAHSAQKGNEVLMSNETGVVIVVYMDNDVLDGTWHHVWIDLYQVVKEAVDAYDFGSIPKNDFYMESASRIYVSGQMFRLDNIIFRAEGGPGLWAGPDLFEMGPLYAQIFEPYRYLFIADYEYEALKVRDINEKTMRCRQVTDLMLNPDNFLLVKDPKNPNDPVVRYWMDLGADPNLFGRNDPNMAALFGRDEFTVDLNLPVFADPEMRMTESGPGPMAERVIDHGALEWGIGYLYGRVSGRSSSILSLQPLPIDPYDGMPTFLPARYSVLYVLETYGKPYYSPKIVSMLEGALWNAGVTAWPNIAVFDYTPGFFEDRMVTIRVKNDIGSDERTFPLNVVNYTVMNYPPVLQEEIEDQIFYVGEGGQYIVNFIDPDCFIFSMSATPIITHMPSIGGIHRGDMDDLMWGLTFNGLANYQYGPWIEGIINPSNGLINWVPKWEGAFDVIVSCSDTRGGMAFGAISILSLSRGTWTNHPPVILGAPTEPVVIMAGEEFILYPPNFSVEDPDGDQVYALCNIGTCWRGPDGSFIWKFQSNFPGTYMVEIIFYDIRAGKGTLKFQVEVKPWWSY